MSLRRRLGTLSTAIAVVFFLAGCSHAVFPNTSTGGSGTAPVILTVHDTPATGITITSFEITVTGATITPSGGTPVSLLPVSQKLELTQLQTNSAFLSTTQVNFGSFSSMTMTFSNPQFTFINDTGAPVNLGATTCNAGASCVVTPTISGASSVSFSGTPFPIQVAQSQQNLLEVDLNLNNIIQSISTASTVNFGATGAATITNTSQPFAGTNVIGFYNMNGTVQSVGNNTFTFAPSIGQPVNVSVSSSTAFDFPACMNNDFSCLEPGQLVSVQVDILTDGSLAANSIAFDDVSGTQQLTGEIVAFIGAPPTGFTMIVHNEVPSLPSAPIGTPINVTIGNTATFNVNNYLFVLPSGVSFATVTDLMVGQEVEARLSGTFTAGPPASFTTDRINLDASQVTAAIFNVSSGTQSFFINGLPALFTNAPSGSITQINVLTDPTQTIFQPAGSSFNNLTTVTPPNNIFAVGGFLFNTTGMTGSPTVAATIVRPSS